jgi:hypothetical protein
MLKLLWNFYFLSVIIFHIMGYINASFFYNILLFVFIFTPLEKLIKSKYFYNLKHILGFIAAFILLWNETYFPPLKELYDFLANPLTRPSMNYIIIFAKQMINLKLIAVILILFFILYYLKSKKAKIEVITFILLFVILFSNQHKTFSQKNTISILDNFYSYEKTRKVTFVKPDKKPDFNIILIQICSFAWDDIVASKTDLKPLFSKFDYIFSKFNAATAYSVPAAIRLLRSPCGQEPHSQLFKEVPGNCYLLNDLRNAGYKTYAAFNHDGKYYNMTEDLIKYAKMDNTLALDGLKTNILSFDDTPIYNDYEVLKKWLDKTEKEKEPKMLFYNTISLHM